MAFIDFPALWEEHPVLMVLGGVLLALVVILVVRPGLLLRAPFWLLCHSVYRLRVTGREHVPAKGPALLVCNHVTDLDWLFLVMAQRRHIRFVIFAGWTKVWGLRWLLKWAGVIPIDKSSGPRAIVHSLRQAGEALKQGHVVCIFAEGRFTRTGFLLPFHRGFEQILKHCPTAPIIPVCLEQAWGSIFSFWRGKILWKIPEALPYPVTVAFGHALPATTPAAQVRAAVQKLSADCAVARNSQLKPAHRQFVRTAARWRNQFRACLIDPAFQPGALSYRKTLSLAMYLARSLREKLQAETHVGVLAPPGAAAALANIALAFLGKTVINLHIADAESRDFALRECSLRIVLASRRVPVPDPLGGGAHVLFVEDLVASRGLLSRLRAFLETFLLPKFVLDRWVLRLGRHKSSDVAAVLFTRDAGRLRGVLLSHGNIAANADSLTQVVNASRRDRLLGVLPLDRAAGYVLTLWLPLQIGASVVYGDGTQMKQAGELCRKHGCTIFLATPALLRSCLSDCAAEDFRSLRVLWCGAERLAVELARDFQSKFSIQPLEGYSPTELTAAAAVNVPDQDIAGFRQVGNKLGAIGQPLPGVAARIVAPETGADVPSGDEGLLLFYGANIMQGYWNDPEATRRVMRDGWYVSGETARMDEDGFLILSDAAARASSVGSETAAHQRVEGPQA